MNYLSTKVEMAEFRRNTVLRRAFAAHLEKVAAALHEIEWVDSGDTGPGSEDAAIRACLDDSSELWQALHEAVQARDTLNALIERMGNGL